MKMYTKKALSVAEYAMMRGVTDFSNAAQFNLYESGYSHLCVISKPAYLEEIAKVDDDVAKMLDAFCYILEFEFKGLSGIEDITVDPLEVTDGISTMNVVGKINKQSATEVSMSFTEKSGSLITNFLRYYLEGIKDPRTQAKTYHGLIKYGKMAGGFENEVFNLLYLITDNTMLQLEKSYLLCNAWPTKAPTSIYETEKGSIEKKDVELTWQCFVIDGPEVDMRALQVLAFINESNAVKNAVATTAGVNSTGVDLGNIGQIDKAKVVHLEYDGGQPVGGDQASIEGFSYTAANSKSDLANYVEKVGDENI